MTPYRDCAGLVDDPTVGGEVPCTQVQGCGWKNCPSDDDRLARLLTLARDLPPPTERQRQEQALDFAYGNLAFSTNHQPSRKAFTDLAQAHYGWSADEAEAWATGRTWVRP